MIDKSRQPPEAATTFGEWVRLVRTSRGFRTQGALADAMSAVGPDAIATNYVWQLENNRVAVPTRQRVAQLAKALDVTVADVLRATGSLTDEPNEPVVLADEQEIVRQMVMRELEAMSAAESEVVLDIARSINRLRHARRQE